MPDEERPGEQGQQRWPRVSEYIVAAFRAGRTGVFANQTGLPAFVGSLVVVSVDRGQDMGRVLSKTLPGEQLPAEPEGVLLRAATDQDVERALENREFENRVLSYCAERVRMRALDMKLTACESQLDRRKVRIYFTAEQRTDFRALVRDLAAEFRTRIEMRQIGVRDDARHRDGAGICGRRLCCSAFLREFTSVTLRSVREQRLAPNPAKVSGSCSRLMCCLSYEAEFYRRADRIFPEDGSRHRLGNRSASVTGTDIFRETVRVAWEDGTEETLDLEEFHRRRRKQKSRREPGQDGVQDDGEAAEETRSKDNDRQGLE